MRSRSSLVAVAVALACAPPAYAGVDSPLKHGSTGQHAAEVVIPGKRCPKLANPFECRAREGKVYSVKRIDTSNPYKDHSCQWSHVLYKYHHPPGTGKPWMLEAFTGCRLWRADARWHSAFAKVRVDTSVESMLESTALRAIPQLFPI